VGLANNQLTFAPANSEGTSISESTSRAMTLFWLTQPILAPALSIFSAPAGSVERAGNLRFGWREPCFARVVTPK